MTSVRQDATRFVTVRDQRPARRSITWGRLLGVLIALAALLPVEQAQAQGDFTYRKSITIDRTNVGNTGAPATLTNFPLLISITDLDLKTTANGGDVTDAEGDDIIFRAHDATTCNDGASVCGLDHEIEKYVPSTGQLIAWVRLPSVNTISASSNTVIYIYYGNSSITTSTQIPTGVWDTGFKAVWHMKEAPNGTAPQMKDSTTSVIHGSSVGSMTATDLVAAKVGDGWDLDGSNDGSSLGTPLTLDLQAPLSVSGWAYPTSKRAQRVFQHGDVNAAPWVEYVLAFTSTQKISFQVQTGGTFTSLNSSANYTLSAWTYAVGTWDGTTMRLYVNGALVASAARSGTINENNNNATVGYSTGFTEFWKGKLDEVRVSDSERSGDWIRTEYNNQNSPSTFHTVGSEETGFLTAVTLTSFTATRYAGRMLLQWRTGWEVDNLGFNVYREERGQRTRITPSRIAGSALLLGPRTEATAGHSYRWWDDDAMDDKGKPTYWLEDIDLNGTSTWHGPIVATKEGSKAPDDAPSLVLGRFATSMEQNRRPSPHRPRSRLAAALPAIAQPQPNGGTAATAALATSTRQPERSQDSTPVTAGPTASAASSPPQPESNQNSTPVTAGLPGSAGSSASIALTSRATPGARSLSQVTRALATQRALAAGLAIKVSVAAEGWYRVTQPQLVAAGLDPALDPRTLQLFVDGVEQPMTVTGDRDGRFDPADAIEFYGTGVDTPYTATRVYWVTAGRRPGQRVVVTAGRAPPPAGQVRRRPDTTGVLSFPYTVESKDRYIFFAALQNGDAENFFGALITTEPTDLTVRTPHLDPAPPGVAELEVVLQGVTDTEGRPDHQVGILLNDQEIGEVVFDGRAQGSQTFAVPASYLYNGDNIVTLVARGGEADVSLVDVVHLTYWRTYTADADRLRFMAEGGQPLSIGGFTTAAIRVVDITDPRAIVEVAGRVSVSGGTFSMAFHAPGSGTRTLLAFAASAVLTPSAIRANQPSAWHQRDHAADYVLVSPAEFIGPLDPLKALREGHGHAVAVVDLEDLYDEFSFGQKTPYAVRDFLVRARAAWRTPPRFVTLVGNATTDPRNYLGMGEPDYLPTKMVPATILETASDDWFADADGDGVPELAAIGRLPARSVEQAAAMVAKIVSYEQAPEEPWHKAVTLVADAREAEDPDFAATSVEVRTFIPADYAVSEIRRGELGTAGARTALFARLHEGQAIVNYLGHGSVQIWRGDLLTTDDVPSMTNAPRLPVFVMMNCLNGFFQSLFPEESLAEALVRSGSGGAIAVWASSGVTDAGGQGEMDRALYRVLFAGRVRTLGEAVAAAKGMTGDGDVRRTWILFGDPALRLKGLPEPVTESRRAQAATEAHTIGAATEAEGDAAGPSTEAEAAAQFDAARRPRARRLVDFDGDGRADLLRYAPESGLWQVTLSSTRDEIAGQWPPHWDVVAADLNGDRLADVVLYDRLTGAAFQGLNVEAASFSYQPVTLPPDGQLEVGDFNGDGRDDLLVVHAEGGMWTTALSDPAVGVRLHFHLLGPASTARVADFNGDGWADVLSYDGPSGSWMRGLNDHTGSFSVTRGRWPADRTVQVATFNGDHQSDILLHDPATGDWATCLTSTATARACRPGTWPAAMTAHLADVSGDGRDDVILYDSTTGRWGFARYGALDRVAAEREPLPPGLRVITGDVNADGRADLLFYDPLTGIWISVTSTESGAVQFDRGRWATGWSVIGR